MCRISGVSAIARACAALGLLIPLSLSGQTGLPIQGTQAQVPDHVLYGSLFRNLALMMRKVDQLTRAGQGGQLVKQDICARLQMGEKDCGLILSTAVAVEAQVLHFDAQALQIINDVRTKHKASPGSLVPPPSAELTKLQAAHDATITNAVSALKQQLTPSGVTALGRYLATRSDTITTPAAR